MYVSIADNHLIAESTKWRTLLDLEKANMNLESMIF